jgi:ribonuclease HII
MPKQLLMEHKVTKSKSRPSHQTRPHSNKISSPTLKFEKTAWAEGFKFVCGIDEAGRGALAGPLVAAAVVLKSKKQTKFQDSKLLSAEQRLSLFKIITSTCSWGVGIIEVDAINKYGIQSATYLAYHEAVKNLPSSPDFLLIDHYRLPGTTISQKSITFGDRLSQSIAAASIVAKVSRDKIMAELSKQKVYSKYRFDKHKGYGTRLHLENLAKHGPSSIHRTCYRLKTVNKNIPTLFSKD